MLKDIYKCNLTINILSLDKNMKSFFSFSLFAMDWDSKIRVSGYAL